jgi:hypothetical protein
MVRWEKEIGILPGIKSLTFSGMEAGRQGILSKCGSRDTTCLKSLLPPMI